MNAKKTFFLTVDTEEDNSWNKPTNFTSRNVERLYKFQELCNKYDIKPIYLTNYIACKNKIFQNFVNQYSDKLEIGLHLHAWNSPPKYNLTNNDLYYQPYLHEYPHEIIKNKIDFLTKLLQDIFQTDIISHRGGRYSVSEHIFESLVENGIKIDCSVVPGFNWSSSLGTPQGNGGPNFSNYGNSIFEIFPGLLEIPVSTYIPKTIFEKKQETFLLKRVYNKLFNKQKLVLRSKINNFLELKKVTDYHLNNNNHLEYIIHSSELVLGTSNLIKEIDEEIKFYANLEIFFIYLRNKDVKSLTFKEFIK